MDGKISRQTPFLTDNIHNREMYISVEIILSGLPFQSTENISYGYDDSELNGVNRLTLDQNLHQSGNFKCNSDPFRKQDTLGQDDSNFVLCGLEAN